MGPKPGTVLSFLKHFQALRSAARGVGLQARHTPWRAVMTPPCLAAAETNNGAADFRAVPLKGELPFSGLPTSLGMTECLQCCVSHPSWALEGAGPWERGAQRAVFSRKDDESHWGRASVQSSHNLSHTHHQHPLSDLLGQSTLPVSVLVDLGAECPEILSVRPVIAQVLMESLHEASHPSSAHYPPPPCTSLLSCARRAFRTDCCRMPADPCDPRISKSALCFRSTSATSFCSGEG